MAEISALWTRKILAQESLFLHIHNWTNRTGGVFQLDGAVTDFLDEGGVG